MAYPNAAACSSSSDTSMAGSNSFHLKTGGHTRSGSKSASLLLFEEQAESEESSAVLTLKFLQQSLPSEESLLPQLSGSLKILSSICSSTAS